AAAPVSVYLVAVVALVRSIDPAVAALKKPLARLTRFRAIVGRILGNTVSGTPVVVFGVTVIAELTGTHLSVATFDRRVARLTLLGTLATRFNEPATAAPVTGQAVAVVAFFAIIHDAVTARWSGVDPLVLFSLTAAVCA